MNQPFLSYGRQCIEADDIQAVSEALSRPLITRGPAVQEFEQGIAEYVGAQHAVAFSSGSAALCGAYSALDVGERTRVLTSPVTFAATVTGAMAAGAQPVLVDVDPATGNMDLDELFVNLDEPVGRGIRIVTPVHYAGVAMDMARVRDEIRGERTFVIEDAAHALGSEYPCGARVGCCTYSEMTVFSFHPVKNITSAEGGMVTTNDGQLADRLRRFRNSGIEPLPDLGPWMYDIVEVSSNHHLTDIQAALGLSQLKKLPTFAQRRRELMGWYRELLEGGTVVDAVYDSRTAYHLCAAQIDFEGRGISRVDVMNGLKERGIGTQVHYVPLYNLSIMQEANIDLREFFPGAEAFYSKELTLPLFVGMTKEDVQRVCTALSEVLAGSAVS
jgi:UDP-4-amino-4,6-dideoxy-L-N-acetyl-beta-L-altrosamine transaminase